MLLGCPSPLQHEAAVAGVQDEHIEARRLLPRRVGHPGGAHVGDGCAHLYQLEGIRALVHVVVMAVIAMADREIAQDCPWSEKYGFAFF